MSPHPLSVALTVATPLGPLVLERDGGALVAGRFDDAAAPSDDAGPVQEALARYFGGELDALDAIEVRPAGTPFQARVWAALRALPAGRTTTYGELAAELGSVARAVGRANAQNPLPLFVPCHRVVGAAGALTGYAFGLERKRWLLAHEGATLL